MGSHEDDFYLTPDLRDAFDIVTSCDIFVAPKMAMRYTLDTVGRNPIGYSSLIGGERYDWDEPDPSFEDLMNAIERIPHGTP